MTKVLSLFKSEYDLAHAVAEGNRLAQTTLYERYSSRMLAVCYRYVGNRTEAEDVMIQGFMKIFDKIKQFNFQGSFEGWMRRIFVNEALMLIRSQKKLETDIEEADKEAYAEGFATDIEAEELLKMVNQLPIGYRTVFNLYAIEGYSHQEIAEKLGISEGTSKSQLSRARVILQEKLNKYEKRDAKIYN